MSSPIVLVLATLATLLHGAQGVSATISASAQATAVKQATKDHENRIMRSHEHSPPTTDPDEAAAATTKVSKVNIEVYYETRCPGCIMFINQTLEPLWRTKGIYDVLNVTLYTYGNAMTIPLKEVSEGYKFWHPKTTGADYTDVHICQHGGDECMGNMVQLCAKDIETNDKYMELVFCMSATTIQGYSVEKSSFECMQRAKIDHDKVRDCVQGPKGNKLMTSTGEQTAMLKGRKGTPWVMINNVHAADEVMENSTLLMQAICSHVENAPSSCSPWKAMKAKAADADPAPKHEQPDDGGDDFQVLEKNMFKVSPKHV